MLLLPPQLADWNFLGCPGPPDWMLDFEALVERFTWLAAMADCPQDPHWHAEGDVLIHTQMVCEALIGLPAWRELPQAARAMLFAATLMHDIAKPACTREEAGRITSRGHARRGASMARQVIMELATETLTPDFLRLREAVVALVRQHGVPLYFLDRESPQRAVIAASQTAPLDLVAILAEADVLGRACADQSELLDRVGLFRELAREHNCLEKSYEFASPHSRFVYFHRDGVPPEYEAYDDTTCEVVLMSGLPGAGKDSWVRKNLPDWPCISLDALRREMKVDPTEDQGAVAQVARERARALLRARQNFVWNATNTSRPIRQPLIQLFADYRARVRIVYVETPLPELLERNRRRAEQVPQAVIEKLASRMELPDLTEAHEVQYFVN